jgi:hypothetical protein
MPPSVLDVDGDGLAAARSSLRRHCSRLAYAKVSQMSRLRPRSASCPGARVAYCSRGLRRAGQHLHCNSLYVRPSIAWPAGARHPPPEYAAGLPSAALTMTGSPVRDHSTRAVALGRLVRPTPRLPSVQAARLMNVGETTALGAFKGRPERPNYHSVRDFGDPS